MLNNIAAVLNSGALPDLGAYNFIQGTTVGAGGSSSIDFTSIPSTYKHLQIRAIARNTTSGGNLDIALRFNNDSSTSNYAWHRLFGDGSTMYAQWNTNPVGQAFAGISTQSTDTSGMFGAIVIDVLDYTSVNKNKTVRSLWGKDTNGAGLVGLGSGLWINSASAVNQVTIIPLSGNFAQYSSFALYGIKG